MLFEPNVRKRREECIERKVVGNSNSLPSFLPPCVFELESLSTRKRTKERMRRERKWGERTIDSLQNSLSHSFFEEERERRREEKERTWRGLVDEPSCFSSVTRG